MVMLRLAQRSSDAPKSGARVREEVEPNATPLTPEGLYSSHFSRVWRTLRRFGVSEEALEDAAQDVFVVVFRRFETWDPERCSVETWLFGITRKVASRHRRTTMRRLMRFFSFDGGDDGRYPESGPNAAELLLKKEALTLVEHLLSKIEPRKRELIILVDVEQLSVVEAADALDLNVNTAYSRLRSGREELSQALSRIRAAEAHQLERGRRA